MPLESYQEQQYLGKSENVLLSNFLTEKDSFCSLIITRQPFPKSIKQNTKSAAGATEEPIVVELIKAPKADCRPLQKVKAEMSLGGSQPIKKGRRISLSMQNDQQPMSREGVAKFPDLRFVHGTRLLLAYCRFGVQVEYVFNGTVQQAMIESSFSRPFIVMTNENQWESSAGLLLKNDLFSEQIGQIPWCKVGQSCLIDAPRVSDDQAVCQFASASLSPCYPSGGIGPHSAFKSLRLGAHPCQSIPGGRHCYCEQLHQVLGLVREGYALYPPSQALPVPLAERVRLKDIMHSALTIPQASVWTHLKGGC